MHGDEFSAQEGSLGVLGALAGQDVGRHGAEGEKTMMNDVQFDSRKLGERPSVEVRGPTDPPADPHGGNAVPASPTHPKMPSPRSRFGQFSSRAINVDARPGTGR